MSQLFMLQKNRDDAEIIFRGASHSSNNESQPLPCLPVFLPQFPAFCCVPFLVAGEANVPPCPFPPAVK